MNMLNKIQKIQVMFQLFVCLQLYSQFQCILIFEVFSTSLDNKFSTQIYTSQGDANQTKLVDVHYKYRFKEGTIFRIHSINIEIDMYTNFITKQILSDLLLQKIIKLTNSLLISYLAKFQTLNICHLVFIWAEISHQNNESTL